ncbi:hypothetical protein F5Y04DRAFT_259875 [Hypomontagnella monticulosa]|nr:hypothetical protein F5Y04DRAFT_259875 [Hypomontagnella monticulosa]
MVLKLSIVHVTLALACLVSIGSGQTRDDQVAWLRNLQDNVPTLLEARISEDNSRETHEGITTENIITTSVRSPIPPTIEERDPKKKPTNTPKNTTQSDDGSGSGKAGISTPLCIGVGIVITAAFLQ